MDACYIVSGSLYSILLGNKKVNHHHHLCCWAQVLNILHRLDFNGFYTTAMDQFKSAPAAKSDLLD